MAVEPTSDREYLIKLDSKLDVMCQAVEKLAEAIDKFETEKYADHEKRIRSLEDERNERRGMYRFFIIISSVLTLLAAVGVFKLLQT